MGSISAPLASWRQSKVRSRSRSAPKPADRLDPRPLSTVALTSASAQIDAPTSRQTSSQVAAAATSSSARQRASVAWPSHSASA